MEMRRNDIPQKSSTTEEVVEQIKSVDRKLKDAKGIEKIKLSIQKVKLSHKLSKTDFKTY